VDTVLIGHSIHEDTPVPHLYDGVLDVLPIKDLVHLEYGKLKVFSLNETTGDVGLTAVRNVFSHDFEGDWVVNKQNNDELITTPNHSVYKKTESGYETFYPGDDETSEIATLQLPDVVSNAISSFPKTERWNSFFSDK
jgi:hypothetical protein